MLLKCCTQYASKFGKLSSGHRTGKGQFSFQSQRKAMPKNTQTTAPFHAKMGTIKARNGMDITEAEDIKKRWQEYTEELYKKDLHYPDNDNGVITHLEPDNKLWKILKERGRPDP